MYPLFRELRAARGEEVAAAAVNKMVEGLLVMEEAFVKCSKGKPFFGGESIGYIDIAFGSGLPWFNVVEKMANMKLLDETKMPNLVAWADKFYQDPAVKDVLPDVGKLIEFNKMVMAKEAAAAK
ncbi:transferase [Lithospermum erythrorhizon]|uniref:Glutathione S-transferase n=1 Tax=Lithospermum erythrorhizon TaxID=34254 RepID=A0AAV3NU41_LITER